MKKKILLVEPNFPYPNKSKQGANSIHKNFVPIGLLKFSSMHKSKGNEVQLIRGNKNKEDINFVPDEILVTSLFTYWSKYVWDSIEHYRNLFPKADIWLGGIYATLHVDTDKFKESCKKFKVKVFKGVHSGAEKYAPDYSLVPEVEYHATHMMRGCIRRCAFCGTWRIEPKLMHKGKEEIIEELKKVGKNKVIFYDNNILANPNIKEILREFPKLKINGQKVLFESQSGFDGRLISADPELSELIKKAGFKNIRIAWDNSLEDKDSIKKQIDHLSQNGYAPKEISVFMIYNFNLPYEDMIKKLNHCKEWGVQITDCRFRPLESVHDDYNPHLRNGQPEGSFYIHKKGGWTDQKIRDFRRNVRKHNIWVRYAKDKGAEYDKNMEKWSAIHNTYKFFKLSSPPLLEKINNDPKLQKRIKILNRIKEHHKKNNIPAPDFRKMNKRQLKKEIDKLLSKLNL